MFPRRELHLRFLGNSTLYGLYTWTLFLELNRYLLQIPITGTPVPACCLYPQHAAALPEGEYVESGSAWYATVNLLGSR